MRAGEFCFVGWRQSRPPINADAARRRRALDLVIAAGLPPFRKFVDEALALASRGVIGDAAIEAMARRFKRGTERCGG